MGKWSRPRFKPETYPAAGRCVTEPYHTVVLFDGVSDAVQMFYAFKICVGHVTNSRKRLCKRPQNGLARGSKNRHSLKTFNCHNLLCVAGSLCRFKVSV